MCYLSCFVGKMKYLGSWSRPTLIECAPLSRRKSIIIPRVRFEIERLDLGMGVLDNKEDYLIFSFPNEPCVIGWKLYIRFRSLGLASATSPSPSPRSCPPPSTPPLRQTTPPPLTPAPATPPAPSPPQTPWTRTSRPPRRPRGPPAPSVRPHPLFSGGVIRTAPSFATTAVCRPRPPCVSLPYLPFFSSLHHLQPENTSNASPPRSFPLPQSHDRVPRPREADAHTGHPHPRRLPFPQATTRWHMPRRWQMRRNRWCRCLFRMPDLQQRPPGRSPHR